MKIHLVWIKNCDNGEILYLENGLKKFHAIIKPDEHGNYERWYNLIIGYKFAQKHGQEVWIDVEDAQLKRSRIDMSVDFKIFVQDRENRFLPKPGFEKDTHRKDTE